MWHFPEIQKRKQVITPKLCVWKLRDHSARNDFLNVVKLELDGSCTTSVEDTRQSLKDSLLSVSKKICGYTLRKKIGGSRLGGGMIPSMLPFEEKRRLYKARCSEGCGFESRHGLRIFPEYYWFEKKTLCSSSFFFFYHLMH